MPDELKEFLEPESSVEFMDRYFIRCSVLNALRSETINFHGRLLDVGCGSMPYKSILLAPPSRCTEYIGLDLHNNCHLKNDVDLEWDGRRIPLDDETVNCAIATEVLEHCPNPELVLAEICRVLEPTGILFFTVPFLWPLHEVPNDECRYTPWALERHLCNAGFENVTLKALGGWDASLAQMLGLWLRRRPMRARYRSILSLLLLPVYKALIRRDKVPHKFNESCMITGLSGSARKTGRNMSDQNTR